MSIAAISLVCALAIYGIDAATSAVGGSGSAGTVRAALPGHILFGHSGDIWEAEEGSTAPITQGGRYWGQPDGSPDGTRLAIVGWNQNSSDIYVLNVDGSDLHQITRGQSARVQANEWAFYPRWSPDGQLLAYLSDRSSQYAMLWVMRPDGTGARQVTRPRAGLDAFDTYTWSPDGSEIAITGFSGTSSQIYTINVSRADVPVAITNEAGGAFDPTWSPDGRHIAYMARDGKRDALRVIDATGEEEPATLAIMDVARSPRWSPNGGSLAYLSLAGAEFELFVMDVSQDADGKLVAGRSTQMTGRFGVDATSGLSWIP
ncbi:MAG TPA: hypothetical protein VFC51_17120 [Chloroflexota bacterium]|nr:hypothetical protein [Chloroflexota bacterium]